MLQLMTRGQRSRLFHEVNDRIYDLLESADPDLPGEFLCECGRDCGRRVVLEPAAFAALREDGGIVKSPDCQAPEFEQRSRPVTPDGVPALG